MTTAVKRRIPCVGFVSLGCPKALVDTERIVTELRAEGYVIASDYKECDLVIVNTCAFIDAAKLADAAHAQVAGRHGAGQGGRNACTGAPQPAASA